MNAPLKALEGSGVHPSGAKGASDLSALMRQIGRDARSAARVLALAPAAQKNRALAAMAKAVRASSSAILAANREDQAEAKAAGATPAFLDRLALDPERIAAMADGIEAVRKLKDPVGSCAFRSAWSASFMRAAQT